MKTDNCVLAIFPECIASWRGRRTNQNGFLGQLDLNFGHNFCYCRPSAGWVSTFLADTNSSIYNASHFIIFLSIIILDDCRYVNIVQILLAEHN